MSLLRRKGLFESTKVLFLPIAAISPNPDQPRTCFSREGLEELAASIQELGVLQPLSVRRSKNGGYELISGERRLRASRMAGLTEVPCILVSVDSQGSSLLALVENLQRKEQGRQWQMEQQGQRKSSIRERRCSPAEQGSPST